MKFSTTSPEVINDRRNPPPFPDRVSRRCSVRSGTEGRCGETWIYVTRMLLLDRSSRTKTR